MDGSLSLILIFIFWLRNYNKWRGGDIGIKQIYYKDYLVLEEILMPYIDGQGGINLRNIPWWD